MCYNVSTINYIFKQKWQGGGAQPYNSCQPILYLRVQYFFPNLQYCHITKTINENLTTINRYHTYIKYKY